MKRVVRVFAELIGGKDMDPDPNWTVVFDTVVDDRDRIFPQHYFGYETIRVPNSEQKVRIPFVFLNSRNGVEVFVGETDDPADANNTTNLFEKVIRVGEMFTFDGPNGDFVYQIREVRPLV